MTICGLREAVLLGRLAIRSWRRSWRGRAERYAWKSAVGFYIMVRRELEMKVEACATSESSSLGSNVREKRFLSLSKDI